MLDPAIILLADDSPEDVTLTQRALRAAQITNAVHVVTSGHDVIEYLTGAIHARVSGGRIPLLILLDLILPDLTGFEVLEWIRCQNVLAGVPVVIYTGSENASDANRAMHLGANSYWVKPSNFDGLVNLMQLLKTKIVALERPPVTVGVAPRAGNVRRSQREVGRRASSARISASPAHKH